MPRKSAEALAIKPDVTGRRPRLKPPAGLDVAAREVFNALVNATDSQHFTNSDLPLLTEYAAACALAREASGHIAEHGAVSDGRVNPWLQVMEKANRAMVALSMRLRLSPQSRYDQRQAFRNSRSEKPIPKIDWSNDDE
jgi:phage terminase small subunit